MKAKKKRATPINVSREAHEKLLKEAFNNKPRLTLRELINIKVNLPKEL